METPPEPRIETRFEAPGSLSKPGPIGRLVRLGFGAWLLYVLYILVRFGWAELVRPTPPDRWDWWAFMAFAFVFTPYVVNIGLTKNWRRRPQLAILVLSGIAIPLGLVGYGSWWAPPLGAFVWLWLTYFSAHLGVSFALSALIATPGCEMRAIPHLWTVLTGRETKEHYCPGVLDRIDRWERKAAS